MGKKVERKGKPVAGAKLLSSTGCSVLLGSSLPRAALRTQGWGAQYGIWVYHEAGGKQAALCSSKKGWHGHEAAWHCLGTGEDKERLPHKHQHYGSLLKKTRWQIGNGMCVSLCPWTRVWRYPCMYLHQGINLFLKNILSAVLLTLPFILFTAVTVFAWMGCMNLVLSSGFVPSPNLVYITLERTHL